MEDSRVSDFLDYYLRKFLYQHNFFKRNHERLYTYVEPCNKSAIIDIYTFYYKSCINVEISVHNNLLRKEFNYPINFLQSNPATFITKYCLAFPIVGEKITCMHLNQICSTYKFVSLF